MPNSNQGSDHGTELQLCHKQVLHTWPYLSQKSVVLVGVCSQNLSWKPRCDKAAAGYASARSEGSADGSIRSHTLTSLGHDKCVFALS